MTETTAIRAAIRPRRGVGWWLSRIAMSVALPIVLLLAWQIAGSIMPNPFIPTPQKIGEYAGRLFFTGGAYLSPDKAWLGQALPTIGRALLGFVLGAAWGVFLGTCMGLSRVFRYSTSWVFEFLRAIPATAVLPIFILFLGGSDAMRVAFIAYSLSLYVLINTANGVGAVDPSLLMMGRSFRLSRAAVVFRIVLPAALPQIYAGLRIGTIGATILAIVSEFFVADNGIGFQIRATATSFNLPAMWSWLLVLSVFGLLLNLAVEGVERRVLGWHRRSH
ncbi:MAG: ABC transporter permease [Microbacteriaceae bacterium]|nr:ABC transporter permease [Microbacteriaceae bacterium]